MNYHIEIASANDEERDDQQFPSENWVSVASGRSYEEVLEYLLRAINDDDFSNDNSWLRLVKDNDGVIEVINY